MAGAMVLGLPIRSRRSRFSTSTSPRTGCRHSPWRWIPPRRTSCVAGPTRRDRASSRDPWWSSYCSAGAALVNVALFTRARARFDVREAMTMTFVSLVLIQFCKAYSFRSERHAVFQGTFENRWLNGAVLWELALLGLIIYLPVLQAPFGTFPLPLVDWLILVGAALTIVPVLETAKWMERRGWFGPLE